MAAAVTLLVLAAAALGGWTFLHRGHHPAHAPARHTHHPAPAPSTASLLRPVRALGFDPLSSPAADQGDENTAQAPYAIDGSTATAWHSQQYATARFGQLKTGTGLILDMGRPVRLSSVTVTFGPAPGANVRIELGNSDARSPATLRSFTTVARATGVGGSHTFTVSSTATGRFVLLWFTKLPPGASGQYPYEAEVFNVTVKGSPA
jgi:hypothetical protein